MKLPNISLELYRKQICQRMKNVIPNRRNSVKVLIRTIILEKTFSKTDDPVVPTFCESVGLERFITGLKNRKFGDDEIHLILTKLKHISNEYFENKHSYNKPIGNVNMDIIQDMVRLNYYSATNSGGYTISLPISTINKLRYMINRIQIHVSGSDDIHIIMAMLIRYSILSNDRAESYQWSIHKNMYMLMKEYFDINDEIFASPLNNYLENFGSLFPDIDKYFGSKGNYRNRISKFQGMIEANPPFIEPIQNDFIDLALKEMEKEDRPLGFVIIMSNWDDMDGFKQLSKNKYLRYYNNSDNLKLLTIFWSWIYKKRTNVRFNKACIFIMMNDTIFQKYGKNIDTFTNQLSILYTKLSDVRRRTV
jgi:hypothetical protein